MEETRDCTIKGMGKYRLLSWWILLIYNFCSDLLDPAGRGMQHSLKTGLSCLNNHITTPHEEYEDTHGPQGKNLSRSVMHFT